MPKATFTRAELRAILGEAHTEEIENKIMSLHLGVVDPLKDALQQAQNEAAKNSGDDQGWKKKYEDLQAQVKADKELDAKKTALREIAKDAGLTDTGIGKALKYTDYASIELDEKGTVKNKAALLKALREEWPEHIKTETTVGANTATPPAGGGNPVLKTREEIYKRDESGRFVLNATERQKALGELIAAQQQKG